MTDLEVARERADTIRILADPTHREHTTTVELLQIYHTADLSTQGFMRAIAPYFFAEDGEPLPLPEGTTR